MFLNINTDAAVIFTNKLEKMHRSGLPKAIRETLNAVALDVKKDTMLKSAQASFDDRTNSRFFKANSRVNFARGWDVKKMKAEVGFISSKLKGGNNFAVKDLKQQEEGGIIKGKSFQPTQSARTSKSKLKNVRKKFRLSDIRNNVVSARKVRVKNKKQRFIRAAIKSKELFGSNAYVLGNFSNKGHRTLSKINSISGLGTSKIKVNRTPVYTYRKNGTVRIAGKNFMKRAAHESSLKMEDIYIKNAKEVIKRLKLK